MPLLPKCAAVQHAACAGECGTVSSCLCSATALPAAASAAPLIVSSVALLLTLLLDAMAPFRFKAKCIPVALLFYLPAQDDVGPVDMSLSMDVYARSPSKERDGLWMRTQNVTQATLQTHQGAGPAPTFSSTRSGGFVATESLEGGGQLVAVRVEPRRCAG